MKLQQISSKKVTKRDQKQKNNKNGIFSAQHKYRFRIRLKKTHEIIKFRNRGSTIHELCMANYTLVS